MHRDTGYVDPAQPDHLGRRRRGGECLAQGRLGSPARAQVDSRHGVRMGLERPRMPRLTRRRHFSEFANAGRLDQDRPYCAAGRASVPTPPSTLIRTWGAANGVCITLGGCEPFGCPTHRARRPPFWCRGPRCADGSQRGVVRAIPGRRTHGRSRPRIPDLPGAGRRDHPAADGLPALVDPDVRRARGRQPHASDPRRGGRGGEDGEQRRQSGVSEFHRTDPSSSAARRDRQTLGYSGKARRADSTPARTAGSSARRACRNSPGWVVLWRMGDDSAAGGMNVRGAETDAEPKQDGRP